MNYNKKSVEDIDVAGKRVLCRCDFNVPTKEGKITSDKRIVAALPTIRYLLDHGAAVIACSHLGKPKGTWKESLTLAPVAKRLSELLGMEVIFAKDINDGGSVLLTTRADFYNAWASSLPEGVTITNTGETAPDRC